MKRVRSVGLRKDSRPYSFAGHTLLGAALVLLLVLTGCDAKPATQTQGYPPTPVKTQVAREIPVPVTSQYLVSLKSRESAAINPQVEGWIVKINVRSGEHVREGQPILEIDPRVQQATLNNQVEAQAPAGHCRQCEAQFNRAQELFKSGIVSKRISTHRQNHIR